MHCLPAVRITSTRLQRRLYVADHRQDALGTESPRVQPEDLQLAGLSINLAASPKATPLEFQGLPEKEVASVHYVQPSALAGNGVNGFQVRPEQFVCGGSVHTGGAHVSQHVLAAPNPLECLYSVSTTWSR